MSGKDRLVHIPDISTLENKEIAVELIINPATFARLEKIADAFQRIMYCRLAFTVVPAISTSTGGSYVAAFVPDATDSIPSTEFGLQKLTSQQSSVTKKWWESSIVSINSLPDRYYTSYNANTPRWSSPGKFVLAVDGKATQPGSLTVHCEWQVCLSAPSLEGEHDGEPKLLTVTQPIGFKSGKQYLRITKEGNADDDMKRVIYGLKPDHIYKMPYPSGVFGKLESNGANTFRTFRYLKCTTSAAKLFLEPYGRDLDKIKYNLISDSWYVALEEGDTLEEWNETPKNLLRGLQYLCQPNKLAHLYESKTQPKRARSISETFEEI